MPRRKPASNEVSHGISTVNCIAEEAASNPGTRRVDPRNVNTETTKAVVFIAFA
jgi:hypothetical protein